MTTSTFQPFSRLPPELRVMIYDLLIEPRVVLVREKHECMAGLLERFRTSVVVANAPLHPHLAQFTCSARSPDFDDSDLQTTLDQYGFEIKHSDARAGPSTATPLKIDRAWLLEHPEAAWELMRKAALFSSAHLPALLHMCTESRAYLKNQGYELAFATRSFPALTWFNFNIDTLYMAAPFEQPDESDWISAPFFLSGSCWDVSQFESSDLSRIRTLALAGAPQCPFWSGDNLKTFGKFIDLFGALKELHILEWTPWNFCWNMRSEKVGNGNNNDQCRYHCGEGFPHFYEGYLSDSDYDAEGPNDDDNIMMSDDHDVELDYEDDEEEFDGSHCCQLGDPSCITADTTYGLSLYARDPWKLVLQEGIDSVLNDVIESHHVQWDLGLGVIDLGTGPGHVDFSHYFDSRQDKPYYHSVEGRFQEALAGVVKMPPQVFVSHVIPGNAVVLGLKNLRRLKRIRLEPSDPGFCCKNCQCRHA